jgi:rhomboid protease GluP
LGPLIRIRTEAGEEGLDLGEFEARVRRGELAGHCPVRFPPLTGEAWVRADQLEVFRRLHQPRKLYFARAFNLGRFPRLTALFIAANVALYLMMGASGPIDRDVLVAWGAKVAPLILDLGQLWRLLTANLLHENVLHIAFNLFVLFNVGGALENVFRPLDYLLLLLASALGTTVVSLIARPDAVTAGASGIVYGTLGGAVVFGIKYRELLPSRYRKVLGEATIPTVLVFLYIGFTSSGVDNWAHLGGLVSGALATLALKPRLLIERPTSARSVAVRLVPFAAVAAVASVGGPWLGVHGGLREQRDDAFGIAAPVPRTWWRGAERFGTLAFHNGLSGEGRAAFTAQAQLGAAGLDEAMSRFVERQIRSEERAGVIEQVELEVPVSVEVGGIEGRLLEGSYAEDGRVTRLRAYVVARGELVYELVYQWSAAYPGYGRIGEQMVAGLRFVEPRALREARARAMLQPDGAPLLGLFQTLERLGEGRGALAAAERMASQQGTDSDAAARVASALVSLGRIEEGCSRAGQALALSPGSPMALRAMANCELARGRRAEAVRLLEDAMKTAPENEGLAGRLEAVREKSDGP